MPLRKIDVFVIVITLAILSAGWLILKRPPNHGSTECIYNLKIIWGCYSSFEDQNGLPDLPVTRVPVTKGGTLEFANQTTNVAIHFRALVSGDLSPVHFLVCPLDKRVKAAKASELTNTNVSYFLSLNPPVQNGRWILSGNRNLSLSAESGPSAQPTRKAAWNPAIGLHGKTGYLLFLDGSVTRVDSIGLETFFNEEGNVTNRIAIP